MHACVCMCACPGGFVCLYSLGLHQLKINARVHIEEKIGEIKNEARGSYASRERGGKRSSLTE